MHDSPSRSDEQAQRVAVKVCGLCRPEDVAAAVAGAWAVGFVFSPSVRRVSPQRAAVLSAAVPRGIARVGVFKQIEPGLLVQAVSLGAIDVVQADADQEPLARQCAPGLRFMPVYRDSPSLADDLAAERRGREGRTILIEGQQSGAGVVPDWSRIAAAARGLRFVLAGGLTPENVAEAVARVRPWGVDVSSGVESSPGQKDPARIAGFIRAAARADREDQ